MNAYDQGRADFAQDRSENAPFASTGGIATREAMRIPEWIAESEGEEYLRGYRDGARFAYGEEWATCGFGWRPVLLIEPP